MLFAGDGNRFFGEDENGANNVDLDVGVWGSASGASDGLECDGCDVYGGKYDDCCEADDLLRVCGVLPWYPRCGDDTPRTSDGGPGYIPGNDPDRLFRGPGNDPDRLFRAPGNDPGPLERDCDEGSDLCLIL